MVWYKNIGKMSSLPILFDHKILHGRSIFSVSVDRTPPPKTYLAFETAKKTFPGDKCEKDDEEGVIRIHRDSFFHGNTLITIRFQRINDNNWFVNVSSEGVGLNQPLVNRSVAETEYYLKALEDTAARPIRR